MNVVRTFVMGAVIGGIFTAMRFPIPAPNNAAGIAGVVGLFAGSVVIAWAMRGH